MIQQRIEGAFKDAIEQQLFPGGVLLVLNDRKVLFHRAFGTLDQRIVNHEDSIYDLASVTKVTATLPAVLLLYQQGIIDIEDPISRYLPVSSDQILIRHLLTHTSGMPPYSEAWRYASAPEQLIQIIYQTSPCKAPDVEVVYSCLNFILLKKLVETITGDYAAFLDEHLFKPLEMSQTSFNPGPLAHIAPTSLRDGKRLHGEVDDELAFYMGGVSGNAGLFASAMDVGRYAQAWLNPGRLLMPSVIEMSLIPWSRSIPGDLKGLGWALFTTRASCSPLFSERSFGHTGFTGTSLWIDPIKKLAVVLLTNRVFFRRHDQAEPIWEFRRKMHALSVIAVEKGEWQ